MLAIPSSAVIQAALQTGCRYGELPDSRSPIQPDSGTLPIRQTKSDKPRHVVLTNEGVAFYKELSAGEPPVSRCCAGKRRSWKASQGRPMAEACPRAKVKPAIAFHGLRHTWATHAVMVGCHCWSWRGTRAKPIRAWWRSTTVTWSPYYIAHAIRARAPRFGMVERAV